MINDDRDFIGCYYPVCRALVLVFVYDVCVKYFCLKFAGLRGTSRTIVYRKQPVICGNWKSHLVAIN